MTPKRFLNKFVKTPVIAAHECLTSVLFDIESNQWNDDRVAVGKPAWSLIADMGDDDPSKIKRFFRYINFVFIF